MNDSEKCCFLNEYGECKILNDTVCAGCSFMKTRSEFDKGLRRHKERIEGLPVDMRTYIKYKYLSKNER